MWTVSRMCQVSFKPIVKSALPVLRNPVTVIAIDSLNSASSARHQALRRLTGTKSKRISDAFRKRQGLEANAKAPFMIGRGVLAGASVAGLGALCYYGMGLSKQEGIIDYAILWPQYVRDRIKTTYMYVGGSIVVAVAAAVGTLRTPMLRRVFMSGAILPNILLCGAVMLSSVVVQMIPYSPGFGAKQIGWLAFSSLIGGMTAPLSFYGGQVVLRAAWYTAGIVGGLSVLAMCAPSEQFLKMGGLLAVGLGVTFASGIGSMFLPPTTMVGAGLHSMFLYGGLVVFSGMLLFNSQRVAKTAERAPPDYNGVSHYDPVNMSMSIFMDIVNIFLRMAMIFGGSNQKR